MSATRLTLGVLFIAMAGWGAASEWESVGTLNIPRTYAYNFLAATPGGDLLAAPVNNENVTRDIPALLIRNPSADAPELVPLVSLMFEPQRGFGGIACDSDNNFYVSADTGDSGTSWVRKFRPDGTPDPAFGRNGELRPRKRCLGLEVWRNYLLMAVDWGNIMVLDTASGNMVSTIQVTGASRYFVRDIAMDATNFRIFGVAAGGVVVWEGGTPWQPQTYQFRQLSPPGETPRSTEGISLDPISRRALTMPIPGNILHAVSNTGDIMRSTIQTAAFDGHMSDSVISYDGTTLYITDLPARTIHVMTRRGGTDAEYVSATVVAATQARQVRPAEPTGGAPAQVTWYDSYDRVVEWARTTRRPMLVYFRRADFPKCAEFESGVLAGQDFARRAARFVAVYEDVSSSASSLLAYRFGATRVPSIILMDSTGEVKARFSFNIPSDQLFAALDSVQ